MYFAQIKSAKIILNEIGKRETGLLRKLINKGTDVIFG